MSNEEIALMCKHSLKKPRAHHLSENKQKKYLKQDSGTQYSSMDILKFW